MYAMCMICKIYIVYDLDAQAYCLYPKITITISREFSRWLIADELHVFSCFMLIIIDMYKTIFLKNMHDTHVAHCIYLPA